MLLTFQLKWSEKKISNRVTKQKSDQKILNIIYVFNIFLNIQIWRCSVQKAFFKIS